MWDPKPDAPAEIRGEFQPISTPVAGIRLSEHLPRSAQIMNKWSIVRSLHHHDAGHSAGDQICFTGYNPGPNVDENIAPSCGSIVAKQLGDQCKHLPPYVMIPRMVPGTGSAYLGVSYKPFETQADPAQAGPFRLPNFALPEGVTLERLGERRHLLTGFDSLRRDLDATGQVGALDRFHQRAWDILTSPAARTAFDLDQEPKAVRERYGFPASYTPRMRAGGDRPTWSQRVLLARRLVEAGVRLVTVDLRWWDTHDDNFWALKNAFLPPFDQAYSALIEDLDARGLLASTLVIAWGEFGRSPRISNTEGRDHYPNVFSAALAGGPVPGGRVVGESDSKGAFPKANPKTPQDVLATLYKHLNLDLEQQYMNNGRPMPILPFGQPITEWS
jgi:hypothetical protein